METSKPKLRVLSDSECIAPKGKFRAVIMIDSEIYQIENDVDDLGVAQYLCYEAGNTISPVAVYDDQGSNCLKGGDGCML